MPLRAPAPANFHVIHLDLAREPGHPEGSVRDRYTLVLPLEADGRIDQDYCHRFPDLCTVVRLSEDGGVRRGLIRREADKTWVFDYGDAVEGDETGFRFGQERFTPGEYVSIERDGVQHPYRVISLQPV